MEENEQKCKWSQCLIRAWRNFTCSSSRKNHYLRGQKQKSRMEMQDVHLPNISKHNRHSTFVINQYKCREVFHLGRPGALGFDSNLPMLPWSASIFHTASMPSSGNSSTSRVATCNFMESNAKWWRKDGSAVTFRDSFHWNNKPYNPCTNGMTRSSAFFWSQSLRCSYFFKFTLSWSRHGLAPPPSWCNLLPARQQHHQRCQGRTPHIACKNQSPGAQKKIGA